MKRCFLVATCLLAGCVTNTGQLEREGPEALLRSAQALVNNGQFVLADRRLSAAERVAVERFDERILGDVYLLRASLAKRDQNVDGALDYLIRSIAAYQSARDYLGEAAARSETIQIYGSKHLFDKAGEQLQLAREAYRKGKLATPDREIPMFNPRFKDFNAMLDSFETQLEEIKKKRANKAPEPTPTAVTPRAMEGKFEMKPWICNRDEARVVPAAGVAHL